MDGGGGDMAGIENMDEEREIQMDCGYGQGDGSYGIFFKWGIGVGSKRQKGL